ncbi:MAG: hypothetical protein AMXMBFR37_16170 [Steroidobacteraceae bacterium]|nr:GTP cyclohydrolase I [Steroidobacteraceae bacterium]
MTASAFISRFHAEGVTAPMPASGRIRRRLKEAGKRFHANDSIAAFLLADEIEYRVHPDGLAIVMEADHFCTRWRGVKDDESAMINSVMRGAFLEDTSLRREFLGLTRRGTLQR